MKRSHSPGGIKTSQIILVTVKNVLKYGNMKKRVAGMTRLVPPNTSLSVKSNSDFKVKRTRHQRHSIHKPGNFDSRFTATQEPRTGHSE